MRRCLAGLVGFTITNLFDAPSLVLCSLTAGTDLRKAPACIRTTCFRVNTSGRVVFGHPFVRPLVRPSHFFLSSFHASSSTEWPRDDRPWRRVSTFGGCVPFSFVERCVRFQSRLRSFFWESKLFHFLHPTRDRSRACGMFRVSMALGCGCKTNACVHEHEHVFRHVSEGAVPTPQRRWSFFSSFWTNGCGEMTHKHQDKVATMGREEHVYYRSCTITHESAKKKVTNPYWLA